MIDGQRKNPLEVVFAVSLHAEERSDLKINRAGAERTPDVDFCQIRIRPVLSDETDGVVNPFTAMGHFHKQPHRWPTFLAMLFQILKEGIGLSLLEKLEVQYPLSKSNVIQTYVAGLEKSFQ